MEPPVNRALKDLLNQKLSVLENTINSDVLTYYGPILNFLRLLKSWQKTLIERSS